MSTVNLPAAEYLDRDRLALAGAVHDAFEDACSEVGQVRRAFRIGHDVVCVHFAGPALVDRMMRALAPLEIDADTPATATIEAWDSTSTGRRMPMLIADLLRLLDATWLGDRGWRGDIREYCGGAARAAYYGPRLLSTYDSTCRRGTFWLQDEAALPWYEPGAPFRVLLDWMLVGANRQLVHAGAVCGPGGGILLGGAGGSGKSTSALSCLGHPAFRYVSDDYVVVELDEEPGANGSAAGAAVKGCRGGVVARSIYATAKVKSLADLARFPQLRPSVTNLHRLEDAATQDDGSGTADEEKPMLFVHEALAGALASDVPVRALVFPRYLALDDCTIAPLRADVAFKLLAPSTVQQVPTDTAQALRCMRTLTQRVPAYGLGLPTDSSKIPDALLRILDMAS